MINLYVHTSSNHPSKIAKQLTIKINERLWHNSSIETIFSSTKVEYENALKKSGYKVTLKYTTKTTAKLNKNGQRKLIWFNPPPPPPFQQK